MNSTKNEKFFLVMLWSMLSLLIPIFLLSQIDRINLGIEAFLIWLIIIYCSMRFCLLALQAQKRLISMTFWIFVYIFLGLTPLIQVAGRIFPWSGSYSTETLFMTFIIIIFGLLSFDFSGKIFKPLLLKKYFFNPFFAKRIINQRIVFIFSLLAIPITFLLVQKLGGYENLFIPRHERFLLLKYIIGGEGQARLQLYSILLKVPAFIAFFMLLALFWFKKHNSIKIGFLHWVLLIMLFLISIVINNPISSARYWFGTIILSIHFMSLRWRRYSFTGLGLGLILLLIIIFPFADLTRSSLDIDLSKRISSTTIGQELSQNGDYDSFQQIMNSVEYVNENGFTYGKQLMGTLLFWFPREIWTHKPLPTGELIASYAGYTYRNLSLPLWGELYLDGGLIFVIIFFMIYGSIINEIEKFYIRNEFSYPTRNSLFLPLYAAYQFYLLRGTLMSAFAYLVPVLLFIFICTTKKNLKIKYFRGISKNRI